MELGSGSWMVCLAAELFLSSCFSDTVFVTWLRTAVETAISGVQKLLRTGQVPILLFWRWLSVSSVFAGRSAWTVSFLIPVNYCNSQQRASNCFVSITCRKNPAESMTATKQSPFADASVSLQIIKSVKTLFKPFNFIFFSKSEATD